MKKTSSILLITLILAFSVAGFSAVVRNNEKWIQPAPPAPEFTASERVLELEARRQRVAAMMDDNSVLILLSAPSKIYANDIDYVYRQENNLFYLTALGQNGIGLVLSKYGGKVETTLFVPKRIPQAEVWNGKMLSNEDAAAISGIGKIVDAGFWTEFLLTINTGVLFDKGGAQIRTDGKIYLLDGNAREYGAEAAFARQIPQEKLRNALPIFAKLRLIKSSYEIKLLQHAIDITNESMMRSMAIAGTAEWEYEVHAEVEYTFRRRNADFWSFPPIVGCGTNATTLHYVESQGKVSNGELLLMDIGAEYQHYAADITRTFPVNGKFSKEQADIYQIVYDAQEAAAKTLKPGATMFDADEAARKVVDEGLFKLGLVTKKNSRQSQIWFMHGVGHWLGMNVHDVGNQGTKLAPGMILTNEPGIYIRSDALDNLPDTKEWREFKEKVLPAFEKYKNIGVRIEDDMLITDTGVDWMTKALPRSISGIEAFMEGARNEVSH